MKSLVVAIDGPGGSGKSTIARIVAQKLEALYIDTGAMFRGLGILFDQAQIDLGNTVAITEYLSGLDLRYGESSERLLCSGEYNLTPLLRDAKTATLASSISQVKEVRAYLLNFQRKLVLNTLSVMEGRDIGSVVFPNAFCKIYLSASIDVRANRRFLQMNKSMPLDQVKAEIISRDEKDKNRDIAPLIQAEDAVYLDTSDLTEDEVLATIMQIVQKKQKE